MKEKHNRCYGQLGFGNDTRMARWAGCGEANQRRGFESGGTDCDGECSHGFRYGQQELYPKAKQEGNLMIHIPFRT